MADISDNEEDILSYALFPQVALKYFVNRKEQQDEDIPQILSADSLGQEAAQQEEMIQKTLPQVRKKPVSKGDDEMNIDELRELILLFDQTSIAELELQKDSLKINLRKTAGSKAITPEPMRLQQASRPMMPPNWLRSFLDGGDLLCRTVTGCSIVCPARDHVKKGQTLCIVEA
jgi:oxaloacetate decarboxylase alpha subunit